MFDVETVIAKDTLSVMKLAGGEIEESTFEVIDYGLVSHSMTISHVEFPRAILSFHLSAS